MRKEDYVRERLRRMERENRHGVYFIFKSMEQGPSFRSVLPKFPTEDSDYRILRKNRSRFTHYYFYIRDEVLGPMVMRVASFFPFQTTYWLNGHSFMEKELNRAGIFSLYLVDRQIAQPFLPPTLANDVVNMFATVDTAWRAVRGRVLRP